MSRVAPTTSRTIAVGGAYLLGSQVVVGVGQFLYAAVTARALPARSFGDFALALTATGLIGLLLTTGLATFAVSARDLAPGSAWGLNALSWGAGLVASSLVLVIAPLWVSMWGASGDATETLRWMSLQVFLSAPGVVQVGLLRREGRPRADAGLQALAALLGLVVGAVAVTASAQTVSLTVGPITTAALTLFGAFVVRRHRYQASAPRELGAMLRFSFRVSNQNIVFFLLTSIPIWAVSLAGDVGALGQFSRAVILSQFPSLALASAMTRTVQPFYRRVEDPVRLREALDDAVCLASLLAIPALFGLAAVSRPLVDVWLGAGWDEAASLAPPLAAGAGVYVVFTVAASAGQTLGALRVVSLSQAVMLPVCLLFGWFTVETTNPTFAALALPVLSVCGLATLLYGLAKHGMLSLWATTSSILAHTLVGGAVSAVALVTVLATRPLGSLNALGLGCIVGGATLLALIRLTPGWGVLTRRGLLPMRR